MEVNAQAVSNLSGGDFFLPFFPHWVNAAGPNKEKEMWFNGVHKSVFHAANSKRHMLFRLLLPAPPRVGNLVKVQCFQSCLLWELGVPDVILFSTVVYPLERSASYFTYIHTDGPSLHHLSDPTCQNRARGRRRWGQGDCGWSVIAVLHRSTEGSTSLNTNC